MKYKIYVDMDGVLTDWDSRFEEYSNGISADNYTNKYGLKAMWDIINRAGVKWWSDMKWLPNGKILWKHLLPAKPTILSKPSLDKASVIGKKIWLRNNMPNIESIITNDKSKYASPNSILIDDDVKNIDKWEQAGGIGILHKNLNDTVMKLNKILGKNTIKTFKQYFTEATQQFTDWNNAVETNPMLKAAVDLLNKMDEFKPGSENLIVGGAVRDLLMGKTPKDIDIVTNIPVENLDKQFKSANIGKSKSFGIVSISHMGHQFDVANYRTEQGYSDGRHPDTVNIVQSFEQDSARRDFTINALGIDKNGTIIDYHNGLEDLKNKMIRAVGNAQERFKEDSLRIFRLLRFAARLGFSIDPGTLKAATDLKNETSKISIERITGELYKAANSGKSLAQYIEHLDKIGLLEKFLPEIKSMQGMQQPPSHHPEGDVYQHTISALRASRSDIPLHNIAILLHDLGKIKTYSPVDHKGNPKHTYYGHDHTGGRMIEDVASRLKMSSDDKNAIRFAIEKHMMAHNPDRIRTSKIIDMVNNPNWPVLKDVIYADEMARPAPVGSADRVLNAIKYMEDKAKEISPGGAGELKSKIKSLIDGNKLLTWFPELNKNKPMIGQIIQKVQEWIINNNKFNATEDDVKKFIKGMLNNKI